MRAKPVNRTLARMAKQNSRAAGAGIHDEAPKDLFAKLMGQISYWMVFLNVFLFKYFLFKYFLYSNTFIT
jgi:hypothetical protein